jgi:hypothetical protein
LKQNEITEAYDYSAKTYVEKCFKELDFKPLDKQLLVPFQKIKVVLF